MPCYIASNANRFYVALETAFGSLAPATSLNRIPAIGLGIRRETELPQRRDKTGLRTYIGLPSGFRSRTQFHLETLLSEWDTAQSEPSYGPMFQAALGAPPAVFTGATIQQMVNPTTLTLSGPHGLEIDQALQCNGEMRFVSAIVDENTVLLNAPFKNLPPSGAPLGPTVTYMPSTELPSISIYDYWDPAEAIQRILVGCGIDKFQIDINGDFHHFRFTGIARELVDNATHSAGQAGITAFPEEPDVLPLNHSIVPGNLGQAWFGEGPTQFFSVLGAQVTLDNNLEGRTREFGSDGLQCLVPGRREVNLEFQLYSNTEPETTALYQAARQRSPVPVMLQLGQGSGQICGVYMKSVVPTVPEFIDTEQRLQWKFGSSRAQGTSNDELVIAFG